MFRNILVPLDGSSLSEASLGAASELAQGLHAPVMLLHVIEQDAPSQVHDERHLTSAAEAEAYLREVAKRSFPKNTVVETHVHTAPVRDVAQSIVDHAAHEFRPDLIVTCTHGRSGVRDLLFGSIAQQIVAQGTTPLLIIKPEGRSLEMKTLLLPLDPDSFHDDSIAVGESLAKIFRSNLLLLSVIPTLGSLVGEQAATSSLMPSATQAMLDLQEENAREHLEQHVSTMRRDGVNATAQVARGDPAATIAKTAEQSSADLIILSTHRKAGIGAFWARSVAPKVANLTRIPLLLIPLSEKS